MFAIARLAFPVLSACLLALAGGCAGSVQQPTAKLRSADVGQAAADGFRVDFGLDVANPNGFALPVSGAKYSLGLGGVPVGTGVVKPSASIPASGSLPVTIPVGLSFEQLMKAEKSLVSSGGNVPYEFEGELEFAAGPMAAFGQSVKVPLKFSGTLAFREAINDPIAFAKSPAGRKILELIGGKGVLGGLLGK